MRIQVLSDFHVDVRAGYTPQHVPDADVVVIAGDVCEGMQFVRAHIPPAVPVVIVAGNHEFYHRGLLDERALAKQMAASHAITFLDDSSTLIGGVRFVGGTLWTDFNLYGAASQQLSMHYADRSMNDFKLIRLRSTERNRFTAKASWDLHRTTVAYLQDELSKPHDGPTVVVTHHAPHPLSVSPRFRGDILSPAFVSDLSGLIDAHAPDLWIHGHTHSSIDERVGRTRIVCNPKGYGRENRQFDPALVVEI